ncbi:hypothetical protein Rsub_11755 [Raphidocelis subcapitata]|uniref:Uncharacterized protein n=1 Tax=Raphidocelis subcapitata TaxID=307507 RepID=A0A2V0PMM9_9CHLO|nr:hypothetical protein Rsub_11755 [Raphidocelis subcapitata]|eukprot:GBF99343.1 hypothetical protein Rsub_11755 [Raphidocelis subcapitata]
MQAPAPPSAAAATAAAAPAGAVIRVPAGFELAQVGPGMFELRPVAPSTLGLGAAPPLQQLPQQQAGTAASAPPPLPQQLQHTPPKKRAPSVLWRERQKNLITDLETQVTAKLQSMQLLEKENKALRLRSSVLQRAVEGWDEQIEIIQTLGGAAADADGAGAESSATTTVAAAAATSRTSGGGATTSGDGSTSASGDGGSSGGAAASGGSGGSAPAAAAAPPPPPPGCDHPQWWALSRCRDPAARIKRFSMDDTSALHREYLALLAPALEALDAEEGSPGLQGAASSPSGQSGAQSGDGAWLSEESPLLFYGAARVPPEYGPPGSARARVYGLVNRYLGAVKHIHLLNPCAVDTLIGSNLESGARQPVPCGFWRAVLAALRLTPAQAEDFCAINELYMQHIAPVLEERAALQARLGCSDCVASEMEVSRAITSNLNRELSLRRAGLGAVWLFWALLLLRSAVHV